MKKLLLALLLLPSLAYAQIIPTLPVTLTNGTLADANQVMSDFNTIVTGVNTNAAKNGANADITSLNALSTPITQVQGGTIIYTAPTSTGSANAQVITTPTPIGFSLVQNKGVLFNAGFTNTGPLFLTVAGTGSVQVFQHGPLGIVPLAGGEIVVGQLTLIVYDGTQYQLFDASPQNTVASCTVIDYAGVAVPSGYLATDGSAVSRTTFTNLFNCLNYTTVAATLNSTTTVTVPNSALFQVGWSVGGSNVTCNSTITSIPGGGTTIVINNAAGATGASTLSIGPFAQGDCSTTFNLPNYLGRATVMADDVGSTLTATTCTRPASIGSNCGTQTKTLVTGNLPAYTPTGAVTLTGGSPPLAIPTGTGQSNIQSGSGATQFTPGSFAGIGATFTGAAQGGTSTPLSSLAPISLVTKAIKF
jgi:hypothetical protein